MECCLLQWGSSFQCQPLATAELTACKRRDHLNLAAVKRAHTALKPDPVLLLSWWGGGHVYTPLSQYPGPNPLKGGSLHMAVGRNSTLRSTMVLHSGCSSAVRQTHHAEAKVNCNPFPHFISLRTKELYQHGLIITKNRTQIPWNTQDLGNIYDFFHL